MTLCTFEVFCCKGRRFVAGGHHTNRDGNVTFADSCCFPCIAGASCRPVCGKNGGYGAPRRNSEIARCAFAFSKHEDCSLLKTNKIYVFFPAFPKKRESLTIHAACNARAPFPRRNLKAPHSAAFRCNMYDQTPLSAYHYIAALLICQEKFRDF